MLPKLPEQGKEFVVEFDAIKENDSIVITTNLPETSKIFICHNKTNNFKQYVISGRKIVIPDAADISKIEIDSIVASDDITIQQIIGEKCCNLTGEFIKYHPIYGKKFVVNLYFSFWGDISKRYI